MKALNAAQNASLLQGLRVTCRIFWGPDGDICRELLQGPYFHDLEDLDFLIEGLRGRRRALQAGILAYSDEGVLHEALEEEYVHLFISRKGGVRTPLYHSCYVGERTPLMGPPALRMIDRFRAAGLDLADDLHEPPDHIAIEGEYVVFLLEKGRRENALRLIEEAVNFVKEEMLPWVKVFKRKLEEEPNGVLYALFAGIFCSLLQIIDACLLEKTTP